MFLDEGSFENKRFNFVIGDYEFDVGDLFDQFAGLDSVTEFPGATGLEIRAHAITQVLGFPDIENLAATVFVQIDAGRARNFLEFFVERQCKLTPQRLRGPEEITENNDRKRISCLSFLRVSVANFLSNMIAD